MLERAGLEAASEAVANELYRTRQGTEVIAYSEMATTIVTAYLGAVGGEPTQAPAVRVKGLPEYERLCSAASHLSLAETVSVNKSDLRVVLGFINETGLARIRSALEAETGGGETFQQRVQPWMMACFGPEISADKLERADRLLEEALELLQSGDYPRERIAALTDYVYSRPVGEPAQEVGGVMVTLAAYCLAHDLDMHTSGETELKRVWTKIEKIRAKQAAKPTGSALPIAAPATTTDERAVDEYVVWSHEHSCWWRASSQGYARRVEDAGIYSRSEAISISHRGRGGWGPDERPDELPVRVADLPDFARAALAQGESRNG